MKTATLISATGIVFVAAVLVSAMSPTAARAEPTLTDANPAFGDVLESLPASLHLCFSEPVKTENASEWKFNVSTPKAQALGIRIVFQPDGGCVDVFPGVSAEPPQGIWTFDWLVRAQVDDSEGSGSIKFQLGALQPGETPLANPNRPETAAGSDGGTSMVLLAAIGAGAALIAVATAGFVISRRLRA